MEFAENAICYGLLTPLFSASLELILVCVPLVDRYRVSDIKNTSHQPCYLFIRYTYGKVVTRETIITVFELFGLCETSTSIPHYYYTGHNGISLPLAHRLSSNYCVLLQVTPLNSMGSTALYPPSLVSYHSRLFYATVLSAPVSSCQHCCTVYKTIQTRPLLRGLSIQIDLLALTTGPEIYPNYYNQEFGRIADCFEQQHTETLSNSLHLNGRCYTKFTMIGQPIQQFIHDLHASL
eukprot:284819746_2